MSNELRVKDLIKVLKHSPQDMPIAVEAMGHTHASVCHDFSHGPIGVSVISTYNGPHVLIGTGMFRENGNVRLKRTIYNPRLDTIGDEGGD